jgi:hypothetical protein
VAIICVLHTQVIGSNPIFSIKKINCMKYTCYYRISNLKVIYEGLIIKLSSKRIDLIDSRGVILKGQRIKKK